MALVLRDSIGVESRHGMCQIELHYGSLTNLGPKNAVDVLVVSAFPGSYAPVHRTVIGALENDLGVSVLKLARDKEEDLRSLFSCWWSKPLPACKKFGFERIMCFEGGYKQDSKPPAVIGEVFRSLVSLCKDKEIKVAMPLLASGMQKYSEKMMLGLIVDAAIHWIQVGLPLQTLKIVVYKVDVDHLGDADDPLLKHFQGLKIKQLEAQGLIQQKVVDIKFDIYLSYSLAEEDTASKICKKLQEIKGDIRIFSEKQIINDEESWQADIYEVMSSCSRVVALLSPSFLKDSSCVEQYNIALCCTRNMKRDFLAPLYLEEIREMPTYMQLIQYLDCRPMDESKIFSACSRLCTRLISVAPDKQDTLSDGTVLKPKPSDHMLYEVFISYSRRNSDVALQIKDWITESYPNWRVFIDTSVLEAGTAWQITLYKSLEHSRIILPLLSPDFVASTVCQEEYNLSSLLHIDPSYLTRTVPVVVKKIDELPLWTQSVPISELDIEDENFQENLVSTLNSEMEIGGSENIAEITDVNSLFSAWRTHHLRTDFPYFPGVSFESAVSLEQKGDKRKIFLSYHENDKKVADILCREITKYVSSVDFLQDQEDCQRSAMLDHAELIVPLISADYIQSDELHEELHIGLCKLRFAEKCMVLPIFLEPPRSSPAFLRILNVLFEVEDRYWATKYSWVDKHHNVTGHAACFRYAALFISQLLEKTVHIKGHFKLLLSVAEMKSSLEFLKGEVKGSSDLNPLGPALLKPLNLKNGSTEQSHSSDKCRCRLM